MTLMFTITSQREKEDVFVFFSITNSGSYESKIIYRALGLV